ncbi:MAG TPA: hypothetical protein VE616_06315 [Candidatus Udaeobacter sp.]|nr:hypothetical protein [Candidatus Udaeobacter sp.]
MKYAAYAWGIGALCLIVVVILLVRVSSLTSELQAMNERNNRALTALQESLKHVQAGLATAKESVPGWESI